MTRTSNEMVPCQNSPSAAGEKGEGGLGGGGGGLEGSLVALTADRWHSRAKRSIGDVTDVPRAIAPVQGTDAGLNIWPGAGVGPGNARARQWPVTRQEARRAFTAGGVGDWRHTRQTGYRERRRHACQGDHARPAMQMPEPRTESTDHHNSAHHRNEPQLLGKALQSRA